MDGERVVHRYQEVVMAEDGMPVQGTGGLDRLFVVDDDVLAFL
jgi:hypothetical protein